MYVNHSRTNRRTVVAAMLVAAAVFLVALLSIGWHLDRAEASVAVKVSAPTGGARWLTQPCPTEDSVNCYWNAAEQGNGTGRSFYVRQFPGSAHMVCVMYVDRGYARSHDYCTSLY